MGDLTFMDWVSVIVPILAILAILVGMSEWRLVRVPVGPSPRVKLRTEKWGDGSSSPGCTNIVSDELEAVIAADVQEPVAERLCELWNKARNTDLTGPM